jgi:hypothetical protein
MFGFADERLSILQASGVDHRPVSRRRVTDRADVDTALAAQQIIRGPGPKPVAHHLGKIPPDPRFPRGIRHGAGAMAAAEGAGAGPDRLFLRRLGQPQVDAQVSAMAATLMLHPASFGALGWKVQTGVLPLPYQDPVFGMLAHGSAAGRAVPCCNNSSEIPSGVRMKAMRPSRGGRLMVTPLSI